MHNPTLIQEPSSRRLIYDVDLLADTPHNPIDRDELTSSHSEIVLDREAEFATEWQMESAPEETSAPPSLQPS